MTKSNFALRRPGGTQEAPSLKVPVLATLLVATFMGQFDFFVVNVAAPSLRHDLATGGTGLELVVGSYAFSYAGALVLGGRLGDLFGHRRLFTLGMIGFGVMSALCGLSANVGELIAARIGQGLGAAMMLPQVLGLISLGWAGSARAAAMAWYGVAGGAGALAGQVFGGLLITADVGGLGWRLIFWVNVPVAGLGAAAALRFLPTAGARPDDSWRRLDLLGSAGVSVTLALLLTPLSLGRAVGWAWWTWLSAATAVASASVTIWWEGRVARLGRDPVLPIEVLGLRSFRAGLVASIAFMAYFAGYMFALALFLQDGLGLDALGAGLVFAPAAIAFSVTALLGPRLVRRWGSRALVSAAMFTTAALLSLAATVSDGRPSVALVGALSAGVSLGNGLLLPTLVGASLIDVPPHLAGLAAGTLNTAQQFAGAAGVAGIGTVYFAAQTGLPLATAQGHGMSWAAVICAALVTIVAVIELRLGRLHSRSHGRELST